MIVKFLVLGAGPSGLVFTDQMLRYGHTDILLVERNEEAGGLCRSKIVDGAPLDIGGGHFLDKRNEQATSYLFDFMPQNEWNYFEKESAIHLHDQFIGHPLEANLWQLPRELQIKYLKSIALAGCNLGTNKPDQFIEWIHWKLGGEIADNYMLPYNKKMFGDNLNKLGTYWLHKLPNISFEETLGTCLGSELRGSGPAHNEFYYPKEYGYGEVWKRIADACMDNLVLCAKISDINLDDQYVILDGKQIFYENLITTIPWRNFASYPSSGKNLIKLVGKLENNSIVVRYSDTTLPENYHWTYHPDSHQDFHRILLRSNFITGAKGHWQEINKQRYIENENSEAFDNEFAYPLNTIDKPAVMRELNRLLEGKHVTGLGRWGEHNHHNSDVCVTNAMELAALVNRDA
jgi:protoporphyrinogen oxidase|tara:strand:+ start:7142 stop:8353 length:1212 start_codon:yes stop_codon:yes gene_type:complete